MKCPFCEKETTFDLYPVDGEVFDVVIECKECGEEIGTGNLNYDAAMADMDD